MPPSSAGSAASLQDTCSPATEYTTIRGIASGNSGFVVEAVHHSTGKHYAIKYIPRGAAINKYVAREIVHHSGMLHPHVVAFREVFCTEEHLAIVMEYVNGGDMFQYVKRRGGLKEDEARWYFQQLVMAVSYCHSMGIVNRDIKLENALLVDLKRPILKLCDFGYSKHEEDSRPKTWVGTPGYTAPEVMLKESYDGKKADVWSSGVFLCVMLFCKYPFGQTHSQGFGENDTIRNFLQWLQTPQCRISPSQAVLSQGARSLLLQMLNPDPANRISMAEVCNHPWFAQDLPAAAIRMNDECLRLSGQGRGPGTQTPEEIRAVLAHAMAPLAHDAAALEDDVIERPPVPAGSRAQEDVLYQDADALMY